MTLLFLPLHASRGNVKFFQFVYCQILPLWKILVIFYFPEKCWVSAGYILSFQRHKWPATKLYTSSKNLSSTWANGLQLLQGNQKNGCCFKNKNNNWALQPCFYLRPICAFRKLCFSKAFTKTLCPFLRHFLFLIHCVNVNVPLHQRLA